MKYKTVQGKGFFDILAEPCCSHSYDDSVFPSSLIGSELLSRQGLRCWLICSNPALISIKANGYFLLIFLPVY